MKKAKIHLLHNINKNSFLEAYSGYCTRSFLYAGGAEWQSEEQKKRVALPALQVSLAGHW
jgi:hypothetical protein